ncbi:hypothetical protein SAMD00019534_125380 [Acytostelium subglobosum LB1]|uniref:hypothetical protein n=1 Tax=Acytostelium subglobosum LB1 TaxID=1410327 RepID=UPI000644CB48|nr:hypothetical protein SAMD00019534_125380 [Acytostelium subglobosum LB1]GAM29362.1 hypothetical protein SAMD00019534_125380 [Acytostelium subglobosum LB1]|eukprot:XP_012747693.1 hypothetical protein SAMD00019534_125380 [Acytostelium subglobosum LB1]
MDVDHALSDESNQVTKTAVEQEHVEEPKKDPLYPDYNKEFHKLFFSVTQYNKTPIEILKNNAFSGELASSPLRGLAWRLFLGCLDVNSIERWQRIIIDQRNEYTKLLEDHYVDPRNTTIYDPLSNDENVCI